MTEMITNYPIIAPFFSNEKKQSDVYNLCFVGGISEQWCHENILKSIEHLSDVKFLLAGTISDQYMNVLKKMKGWKNVHFFGKIPHEKVKNVYQDSSAGLCLLSHKTQVGKKGTLGNTKIFEYMEAGIPIVCSNQDLWMDIIKKYQCGIAVNPEDIHEIKKAILFLKKNPKIAKKMGQKGRIAIENTFNWSTQEKKLILLYHNILFSSTLKKYFYINKLKT